MFFIHMRRMLRNPLIFLSVIGLWIGLIYYFTTDTAYDTYLQGTLCNMILAMPYVFLIFLFVSYESFYILKQSNVNEVICVERGSLRYQMPQFILLFICGAITAAIVLFYQLRFYKGRDIQNKNLSLYTIRVNIIFVFLVIVFAILLGCAISNVKHRLYGLCLLLVGYYLFDQSFLQLLMGLSKNKFFLWKFATLFTLFTSQNAGAIGNNYYLMSAENVHLYAVLFWIFLLLAIVFLFDRKGKKLIVVWGIGGVLMLVQFFQPTAAVYDLGVHDTFSSKMAEQFYYPVKEEEQKESYTNKGDADFSVRQYQISFHITDMLNAKVSLQPNKSNLAEYHFTLYHSFQVRAVTDGKGNALPYHQNGDWLKVENPNKKLNQIVVEYEGSNQYFYTTSQGIMLPANFEYYPVAGWHEAFLYNLNNCCFTREVPEAKSRFQVELYTRGRYPVYSNFVSKKQGKKEGYQYWVLSGESNGMTLLGSPYASETSVDGVRIIYPVLDDEGNDPTKAADLEDFKTVFDNLKKAGYPLQGKTFIVGPSDNYENYCFAEDHLVTQIFRAEDEALNFYKNGQLYYVPDEEGSSNFEEIQEMIED